MPKTDIRAPAGPLPTRKSFAPLPAVLAAALGLAAIPAISTAADTVKPAESADAAASARLMESEAARLSDAWQRKAAAARRAAQATGKQGSEDGRTAPGACSGRVLNPVTDLCWSCMFPMTLGKSIPVAVKGELPDIETDAPAFCLCGTNINLEGGLNFSFWEPLRTAEVVRHPWCFPSLGGVVMEGPYGSDHARTPKSQTTRRRTAFWNVHWYQSPWMFVTEAVTDTGCLETAPWDLAYLSELDPLWDDTLTSFLLAPDAALFTSAATGAACAADCVAATVGLARHELYWCAGCQGSVFPLSGWMAAMTAPLQAWHLMAHRFAQKLSREGVLWSAHGEKGQCGPYVEPFLHKNAWRTQLVHPSRTADSASGACCQPLGRSTALWGAGKAHPISGEDGAVLLWRKRDCCMTKKLDAAEGLPNAALSALAAPHAKSAERPDLSLEPPGARSVLGKAPRNTAPDRDQRRPDGERERSERDRPSPPETPPDAHFDGDPTPLLPVVPAPRPIPEAH